MAILSVNAFNTIQVAREALSLCRVHDYDKATQCLVEVKRSGNVLVSQTQDTIKRIENFEDWITRRYTTQITELQRLNDSKRDTEEEIRSLEARERYLEIRIRENESNIETARNRERKALEEKADAEDKFDSIVSPLALIPGYAIFWGIRELIENNTAVAEKAGRDAEQYASEQRELRADKARMRNDIQKGRARLLELHNLIQIVQRKSNEEHSKLSQTRSWLGLIVKAQKLYAELAEVVEEAVDSTAKLEEIVKVAHQLQEEIEESGAAKNYENCWVFLDELARGELSGMQLEFTCSVCLNTFNDVPWFVNDADAVFCKNCMPAQLNC